MGYESFSIRLIVKNIITVFFFLTFKNNYPRTPASVSLEEKRKKLTRMIFQKYFKIAKLPPMCTLMSGPSLKCYTGLLLVLRASDTGFSFRSILGLTTSECLIT